MAVCCMEHGDGRCGGGMHTHHQLLIVAEAVILGRDRIHIQFAGFGEDSTKPVFSMIQQSLPINGP